MQNNHVWFSCNDRFDLVFHILCGSTRKPFSNNEIFFMEFILTTTKYISSNRVVNYNNFNFHNSFIFFGRHYLIFFIQMMTRTFNYLLFCFLFGNFISKISWITSKISFWAYSLMIKSKTRNLNIVVI